MCVVWYPGGYQIKHCGFFCWVRGMNFPVACISCLLRRGSVWRARELDPSTAQARVMQCYLVRVLSSYPYLPQEARSMPQESTQSRPHPRNRDRQVPFRGGAVTHRGWQTSRASSRLPAVAKAAIGTPDATHTSSRLVAVTRAAIGTPDAARASRGGGASEDAEFAVGHGSASGGAAMLRRGRASGGAVTCAPAPEGVAREAILASLLGKRPEPGLAEGRCFSRLSMGAALRLAADTPRGRS